MIETDFLIAGTGPAGASLACFLASYGFKGIMISAAPGTADTPRAHITNMAALECLRDIGLEREIEKVACGGEEHMVHTRWCHSMAGEEYARVYSWGNDPERKGDYEKASPCSPIDIPQTLLEPILVRHATSQGFTTRFNTTLVSFITITDHRSHGDSDSNNNQKSIIATLQDNLSRTQYPIRTKYLFGADGARSAIVKQLNLPLSVKPGQGLAINVLVKADLSHLMHHRTGNLHWVMQPDREHPAFGWMGIVRMVRPWDEWMFILFPERGYQAAATGNGNVEVSREEYLNRVKQFIGDDTPAEILSVSKWYINEIVADRYSEGNVFCLGDAVHRHPPLNGLGSNTCIQDAFNLAWKIAYVHRGLAGPELLSTYSTERQPVGAGIVARANQAFRDHQPIWEALGMLETRIDERRRALRELSLPTAGGRERRRTLRDAVEHTQHEFHALGTEMGQRYTGGSGIYTADESEPFAPVGKAAQDPVLYYGASTYPGCRLPHVWLNSTVPREPVSTIDLAGHGEFTLFTGVGGDAWKEAAEIVATKLRLPILAYSIGFGVQQDWADLYFNWERVRGVKESGAVLVRPDRFVAWRADEVLGSVEECDGKLMEVMKSVLCLY
ncbi:FAD binding domain-containing protein [Aspergillus alliaceus]|uniref:FAD binding domain-containing protein n=1 Tax=Petromyces alliaceus TaxID=209559 RepID=A0A5N7BZ58_PETAA|nr:FAD binding domain-containing protein [Aspergillus alliaceus]